MIKLQKKLEEITKDMPYDNLNNVITVFFKTYEDTQRCYRLLIDFLDENEFSLVKTNWDYFLINKKCKLNLITVRDYLLGYSFSYVIYDKNIEIPFVKHIIKPSFAGLNDKNLIKIDIFSEE